MKEIIKKVLDRHENSQGNMSSDSFRDMLAVEIESNLNQHLMNTNLAKDNPLSIEMWKGYTRENPNKEFNPKEGNLNQLELDFQD